MAVCIHSSHTIVLSLFLLLFLLLGHLDEGVLQHRHTRYQTGELLLLGQLLCCLVGDALGDLVGAHTDLVLREDLLHAHHLLLCLACHSFFCLAQDLFKGLFLGRACVIGQRCAYDIELGGDGEGSGWLGLLDVPGELPRDEGILDELIPCPLGGGSEGSLRSHSFYIHIMRGYVLEADDVLSLLGSLGRRGFLISDSDPIFKHACRFCSSFELALAAGLPLRPQRTELGQFYILVYSALMLIPVSAELVHGVLVVLVAVVVYSFRVVVDLHFGTQLIDDFLFLFGLSISCFFLALNGNIIYIDISYVLLSASFLPLHSLLGQCFLLGHLNLLDQFLLIYYHRWLQFDDLHIGVILILIEDLPLIVLQAFLGVSVFGVDGPQSAVELLLSVFQLRVVDFGINCVQRGQFLVFGLFLKVARDGTGSGGPGVGRLRAGLGGGSHRADLLSLYALCFLPLVIVGSCSPLIDLVEVLLLVLGEGYSGELAEHFEQSLYVGLLQFDPGG